MAQLHEECGHAVERQVYVPQWDRWKWRCAPCGRSGQAWDRPAALCPTCGEPSTVEREEAVLDLDIRSAAVPRLLCDVTVRHSVPGLGQRLAAAAAHDGAVNREAEADKRQRYPDGRTPWRVLPLAFETFGRLRAAPLRHHAAPTKKAPLIG